MPATGLPKNTTVALIGANPPRAVPDSLIDAVPKNFSDPPLLVLRDPATGAVRAFSRQTDTDLFPIFEPDRTGKHPPATMIDRDSGSFWTADGRAIAGPLSGQQLTPLQVDDRVNYDAARFWYADLPVLSPGELRSPAK